MLPPWTLVCVCLFLSASTGHSEQLRDVQNTEEDLEDDDLFTVSNRGFFGGSVPYPVLYRTGRYSVPFRPPQQAQQKPQVAKKALSIFTRWRPTYSLEADGGDSAIVSAVARAQGRPLGQPLRWG